eukprot:1258355-Pleurochrysis_carterae.AAC.1
MGDCGVVCSLRDREEVVWGSSSRVSTCARRRLCEGAPGGGPGVVGAIDTFRGRGCDFSRARLGLFEDVVGAWWSDGRSSARQLGRWSARYAQPHAGEQTSATRTPRRRTTALRREAAAGATTESDASGLAAKMSFARRQRWADYG